MLCPGNAGFRFSMGLIGRCFDNNLQILLLHELCFIIINVYVITILQHRDNNKSRTYAVLWHTPNLTPRLNITMMS